MSKLGILTCAYWNGTIYFETFIETQNSCRVSRYLLIASCYKILDSQTSFTLCFKSRKLVSEISEGWSWTFYLLLRSPPREYLFQPLFSDFHILCVENKHKSLTEWLTGWNCLSFSIREKFKHGCEVCTPSKRFAAWFSDMPVRTKLFSDFQRPHPITFTTSWKYSGFLVRAFY